MGGADIETYQCQVVNVEVCQNLALGHIQFHIVIQRRAGDFRLGSGRGDAELLELAVAEVHEQLLGSSGSGTVHAGLEGDGAVLENLESDGH